MGARSTKESWLQGPGDLKEDVVEDVPVPGESVKVRGLPAAFSSQAQAEGIEFTDVGTRGEQKAKINVAVMEQIQFVHGCVEPSFNEQEAKVIAAKYGPAFKKVVAKIDELSGVDKGAIANAEARFQSSGEGEAGKD